MDQNRTKRVAAQGGRIPENPVKLCCAISRLHHSVVRGETTFAGVMSQPGARLVMPLLAVNGELTQSELVEMTHLRAPSISAILKKMEEEGLVERRSHPEDHRKTRVTLTQKGIEVDASIMETLKSTDALAVEGLSHKEQETLMTLLSRIKENLLRAEEGEACR
jgi:DNA-binding MarR family transcriptional regulator